MNEKILTVAQAAKYLHIGKDKMYLLIKSGRIKAINLWVLKIKVDDLDRFINDYTGHTINCDGDRLTISDTLIIQG